MYSTCDEPESAGCEPGVSKGHGGGGAPPGEIGLIGPMSCCSSNICHSVGEWACTGAGLGIVFCRSRFNSVFLLSVK